MNEYGAVYFVGNVTCDEWEIGGKTQGAWRYRSFEKQKSIIWKKQNKAAIIDKFELCNETLEDIKTGECVDVEEVTDTVFDELVEEYCGNEYNPVEFYTAFAEHWAADEGYDLHLSDDEEGNELN